MFPSSLKEHENIFWVFNIGGDKPAPRGVCFWRCGCGGFSSGRPTGWFSGNLPLAVELELRNPRLELLNDDASGRAFLSRVSGALVFIPRLMMSSSIKAFLSTSGEVVWEVKQGFHGNATRFKDVPRTI